MTAATLWVLFAFLPPDDGRQRAMVVDRFASQAQCLDLLDIFPPTYCVTFDCLPSQRIEVRPLSEPEQ